MTSPYRFSGRQLINFNAAGDQVIVPANTNGVGLAIWRFRLSVVGATVITIKDTAGTVYEAFSLGANGSVVLDNSDHSHYMIPANLGFVINSSSAVQVYGQVSYTNGG